MARVTNQLKQDRLNKRSRAGRRTGVTLVSADRIEVDTRKIANEIAMRALARIRSDAAEGKGVGGKFAALDKQTVERYRREGNTPAGRKSTLSRTGETLRRMTTTIRMVKEALAVIWIQPDPSMGRAPHIANFFRPFVGLATKSFKEVMASVYDVKLKIKRNHFRRGK